MSIYLIGILGIILGSFINALVWRLKHHKNWKTERSICPNCKKVLTPKDLIPVVSWVLLKGRCRYCKKPISKQYPLVELLTGLLFVMSFILWPYDFTFYGMLLFVAWLMTLVILIALLVYDIKWMILPNSLVAAVTIMASLTTILRGIHTSSFTNVLVAILGGAVLAGLFWILFQASKGKWIGGGDVKIAFALGMMAGSPISALVLLFVASIIGTIIILPLLFTKRLSAKAMIPFGPLLITATVIIFLAEPTIVQWYSRAILYA